MTFVVLNIKTLWWHNPTITCVTKEILMKITDTIRITFVNLTEAFIFNRLLDSLAVDF